MPESPSLTAQAASAVAFVTGHGDPESDPGRGRLDWAALARFPGTLVIYMGVTHLAAICRTLLRLGKPGDTPAAVIESGTLASQRTEVRNSGNNRPGCEPRRRAAPCSCWSSDRSSPCVTS